MSDNLGELNKRLRIMTDSINSNLCCLKDIIEKEFGEVEEILLHPFGETCDKPSYVKLCDLETLLDNENIQLTLDTNFIDIKSFRIFYSDIINNEINTRKFVI